MKRLSSVVGLLISFVALVGASCQSHVAPSGLSQPETNRRITVLGDSLAVSPTPEQAFPAELQKRAAQRNRGWRLVNSSDRGDTTADGLQRLPSVLADRPRILIVALGANDGVDGVEVSTVERNIEEIIKQAKARGIRVLLCGMDAPPLRGFEYSIAFHRLYEDLADEYDVPLVPFLLVGIILNPEMTGSDRIHPNAAGAQRLGERIWPYLEELLQQDEASTPAS